MVEEGNTILPKKRIRIKVAHPATLEHSDKGQNSEQQSPEITPPLVNLASLGVESSSSSDENGTYNVPKEVVVDVEKEKAIADDGDTEASEIEHEGEGNVGQEDGLNTNGKEPPVPAPRRNRSSNPSSVETSRGEALDQVDAITPAPQPAPRSRDVTLQEEQGDVPDETAATPVRKPSAKGRRKKRKAAEMIANVLRRESKKTPHVATALQESEDKDKENGYLYSPWDSPPPPTNLEKVYIQHKHGFSVRDWCDFYSKPEKNTPTQNKSAADVALEVHMVWSRLSVFSHGVVAGIAACHALAVAAALAATHSHVPDFVQFYHLLSLKIHFAVYVFTSLCILSCLDRLDVGGLSKEHVQVMGRCHGTLLVTFGYLLSMSLTLAAHRHTAAIEVYAADNTLLDSQGLHEWACIVTVRDTVLLLCWVFMSCSTPRDLLQQKLASLTLSAGLASDKPDIWHTSAPDA